MNILQMGLVVLGLGAVAVVARPLSAQEDHGTRLSGRLLLGTQLSGYSLESRSFPAAEYMREVDSAFGVGVGISGSLGGSAFRVGLEADVLLNVGVTQELGPRVRDAERGLVSWLTARVSRGLTPGCRRLCVELAALAGASRHGYSFEPVIDDIVLSRTEPSWWATAGLGVELSAPGWTRGMTLRIDDRWNWALSDERGHDVGALHMLTFALGWRWQR